MRPDMADSFEEDFAGERRSFRLTIGDLVEIENRLNTSVSALIVALTLENIRLGHMAEILRVALKQEKIDTVLALIKVAGLGQAQFLCIRALNVALGSDADDDAAEPEPGNGDAEAETDGSPSATTSP
ncbi:GTA-gp10 family protein [Pyruvatibacter mobilis]|uniref:GTA-gp10 family protein n=1 Tax=Pyruvatibacter mobilis TaxID=1712261 RepID=UPI003BAD8AB8